MNSIFSDVKTHPGHLAKVMEWEFQLQSSLSVHLSEDRSGNPGFAISHKVLSLNFLKMEKIIAAFQDCFRNLL